jgi:nitroreductase
MTESTVVDLTRYAEKLAATAGKAPSLHNAQPWRLRISADRVDLYADRSRHLPVADPQYRQMHLGLGAAVFALRLALAGLGCEHTVRLLPDPDIPDFVARLDVIGTRSATPTEQALLAQVDRRRTARMPFTDQPIPVPLRVALTDDAVAEGAHLHWVESAGARHGVAALVAAAERRQQADPAYRAELATWTHADTLATGAGVPASAFGAAAVSGHAAPFPLRDFAGGQATDPARPVAELEEHPAVAVLVTDTDRPIDWLAGGQALMRVLLAATAEGIGASQLNQPVEFPALRQQVRDELRLPGWPQVILRLGYPSSVPPATPRRPAGDLLRP